jgi:hypothetical protein
MPKLIKDAAVKAARRAHIAALRAERAPSLSEAEDMFLESLADNVEVERLVVKAAKRMPKLAEGRRHIGAQALLRMAERAGINRQDAVFHLPFGKVDRDYAALVGGGWNPVAAMDEADIARYARFFGFMAAVKGGQQWCLGKVDKRLVASFHSRGEPWREAKEAASTLWWKLFKLAGGSPGKLEHLLQRTRDEAKAIGTAFAGLQPWYGWAATAKALAATGRVRKAAVVLTATSRGFRHWEGPIYRAAREWLIENRNKHAIIREDDGVRIAAERQPELVTEEGAVYAATRLGSVPRNQSREVWLVEGVGNRTFHVERLLLEDQQGEAESALAKAREGWALQDELALANGDLRAFLEGSVTGVCPLITRQDSYLAGNCQAGTDAWIFQRGWRRKTFIPGVWLIAHLDDERVARVVRKAMNRLADYTHAA